MSSKKISNESPDLNIILVSLLFGELDSIYLFGKYLFYFPFNKYFIMLDDYYTICVVSSKPGVFEPF